jgi:hypothetical protein
MIYSIIALSISNIILLLIALSCGALIISQVAEIEELQEKCNLKTSVVKGAKAEIETYKEVIKNLESKLNN